MLWHRMARLLEAGGSLSRKHIQCRQVPVMAILEEFRKMAGERGCTHHRPFPIASYDYECGRSMRPHKGGKGGCGAGQVQDDDHYEH
eukprot:2321791-Prymnesium_polylepis.1